MVTINNKISNSFSNNVFSSVLKNKKQKANAVRDASIFGFQIIPSYLPEKILGLITKLITTTKDMTLTIID